MDAETAERIEKYEAHVRMLEEELAQLATHRGWIQWIPLGAILAPLAFFVGLRAVLAVLGGVLLLTVVAGYLNASRTWYTRDQLAATRADLDKLRHGDPTRDAARDMRFWRRTREQIAEEARRRRSPAV